MRRGDESPLALGQLSVGIEGAAPPSPPGVLAAEQGVTGRMGVPGALPSRSCAVGAVTADGGRGRRTIREDRAAHADAVCSPRTSRALAEASPSAPGASAAGTATSGGRSEPPQLSLLALQPAALEKALEKGVAAAASPRLPITATTARLEPCRALAPAVAPASVPAADVCVVPRRAESEILPTPLPTLLFT